MNTDINSESPPSKTLESLIEDNNCLEIMCFPVEGQVLVAVSQDMKVTHAMPVSMPEDSKHPAQEAYEKSVIEELSKHGEVISGSMAQINGRYFFRPKN